jgi:hypothetical protein
MLYEEYSAMVGKCNNINVTDVDDNNTEDQLLNSFVNGEISTARELIKDSFQQKLSSGPITEVCIASPVLPCKELLANFNDKITIKWNDYMIHITYDDLLTLSLEDEVDNITRCWLNDKIVNSFVIIMTNNVDENKGIKALPLNSFFMTALCDKGSKEISKKWFKKIQMFGFRFWVIPVHQGRHWSMMV